MSGGDHKKTRFTETQILAILKADEAGIKVIETCRNHGISNATYYKLEAKLWWHAVVQPKAHEGY